MTFAVTIPVWAIDGFMALGCICFVVACIKTSLEIALLRLKRKKFF